LARLAAALEAHGAAHESTESNPVRDTLLELGLVDDARERLTGQVNAVRERARAQGVPIGGVEMQLALGVLLVLSDARPPNAPEVRS
jgi:hypothetical protein